MMKNWFWNIAVIVSAVTLGINAPLRADSTQNRKSEFSQDPKTQQAIDDLKSTGLSEQSQESAFALSSNIFEQMAKRTGGDQEKMNALLNQFQRDPASIKSFLSESQVNEIKKLGREVGTPHSAQP